jgi:hypothetical protein
MSSKSAVTTNVVETKAEAAEATADDLQPVILDVGSRSKKSVDRLKRGKGPLFEDIEAAIAEIKEDHADELNGRAVLPIIVICRQRPTLTGNMFFPFSAVNDD